MRIFILIQRIWSSYKWSGFIYITATWTLLRDRAENLSDYSIAGANDKRDVRCVQNEAKSGQTGQRNLLV